jgi:phosphate transport system substrate-binding protein
MKKIIGIVAAFLLMAVVLAACTGGGAPDAGSGNKFDNNRDIVVISREDGSGTRGAFIELFGVQVSGDNGTKDMTTREATIVNKTDVMLQSVAGDTYSIGYVSFGSLNNTVKALAVDGVEATSENLVNGSYGISRPFNIATKDGVSELAEDFISFMMSKEGQEIASDSFIAVDANAPAYAGTKPAGKITVAGSTSVSPLMEKLAEAYQAINTGATIEIQMSGSGAGMIAAIDGTADIGMASRTLKDSELEQLNATVIAIDGIAVITSPESPISNIASEQVRGIFTGEITKWNEINE